MLEPATVGGADFFVEVRGLWAMRKLLRVYWQTDDAMVTLEYSILLLLTSLLATVVMNRVGLTVVDIVDQAAALFR